MVVKKIRRRVRLLDTSNQTSLFSDVEREAGVTAVVAEPRPAPRVKFESPDPRAIFINQVRLDEHLQTAELTAPLRVRTVLESLSFAEFEQAYRPGGRPPYAPRAMVGVMLYGILQGLSSLRDLERCARSDVGCWWLSGGIMPDHSVLGRFVRQHEDLLTAGFFEQLTRQVLKATGSGTATVAGDGTVIEAMSSRFRLVREEALNAALAEAREEAEAHPDQVQATARLAQLEQARTQLQERQAKQAAKGKDPAKTQIHPQEPDAVVQPQKNSKDFRVSYKPSVLANEMRVIVACEVHPSSETEPVARLLDRAKALGQVDTALFDSGYFSEGVIRTTGERAIELLCPEGQSLGDDWNKQSDKQFPKSRFEYVAEEDAYRCPNQQILTPCGQYRGSATAPGYTEYGTAACADCPLKPQCTRSETGRKLKRYAIDAAKDALRAKLRQDEHRERYRRRQGMVEPVFSHLRGRQGLRRFRRRGLAGVRVEFALHAMAYNLSRALAWAAWRAFFSGVWAGLGKFRFCFEWFGRTFRAASSPPVSPAQVLGTATY
jgi:transposase